MVIGEAGESCALYIAKRLGMPASMLRRAAQAAYGAEAEAMSETFLTDFADIPEDTKKHRSFGPRIEKRKSVKRQKEIRFKRGDSVMIYPDKKIGIVCQEANDKGALRVQLPGKKIWISYKRVKLLVAATELYPENYDFSIVFDSVKNRKIRHDMERKYTEEVIHTEE